MRQLTKDEIRVCNNISQAINLNVKLGDILQEMILSVPEISENLEDSEVFKKSKKNNVTKNSENTNIKPVENVLEDN